jgi:hypothetical protein
MVAATLIGVFFTPLFYVFAMRYLGGGKKAVAAPPAARQTAAAGAALSAAPHDKHEQ